MIIIVRNVLEVVQKVGLDAILSTTAPASREDGIYLTRTVSDEEFEELVIPLIRNTRHFIFHPSTQAIVEGLGAVASSVKLYEGLQVGKVALALPLAHSPRNIVGKNVDIENVSLQDLQKILIYRLR